MALMVTFASRARAFADAVRLREGAPVFFFSGPEADSEPEEEDAPRCRNVRSSRAATASTSSSASRSAPEGS